MTKKEKLWQRPREYNYDKFFYYHGDLHQKLRANRGTDVITAWNYPKAKVIKYVYSDVKINAERAYRTYEVSMMLGRNRKVLSYAISDGNIRAPQFAYFMSDRNRIYSYFWTEEDILAAHDFLLTVNIGRPRKDGQINTGTLPSRRELKALLNHGTVLYVKTDDGKFVPTWEAERF